MTTREDYEQEAREQYSDVIGALVQRVTINTDIQHTGGGCLAIRVELGDDWYALITADEDVLPSDRPHGWSVGLYSCAEGFGYHRLGCEGFTLYQSTDPDPVKMVDEIAPVLERIAAGEPVREGYTLCAFDAEEVDLLDAALEMLSTDDDRLDAMRRDLRVRLTQPRTHDDD